MKAMKLLCVGVLFCLLNTVCAQTVQQEKMKQLNYLVGEWVGTTKIYKDGVVDKEGAAYERISYDLDNSILVIELNTAFLQLHTVVTYDVDDKMYHYNRFSKDGSAVYPAKYEDGKLIVMRDEKTRFFFTSTTDGGFQEYGEKLIDGEWVRTFEDTFVNTQ